MATTQNVRFQTDVLAWIDQIREGTGLSRNRVIEMVLVAAREQKWRVGAMPPPMLEMSYRYESGSST